MSSTDGYINDGPDYTTYPGKIYSQDLHLWWHMNGWAKGRYEKDNPNHSWFYFYKALHKNPPASEKIVSWIRYASGDRRQI